MRNLVVVDDALLQSMIADAKFLTAIPCLAQGAARISNLRKNCSSCNRQKSQDERTALNALRTCIATLSGGYRTKLGKLLDARQIRVIFTDSNNRRTQLTFRCS